MRNQFPNNLKELLRGLGEDFKDPTPPTTGISTCWSYTPPTTSSGIAQQTKYHH